MIAALVSAVLQGVADVLALAVRVLPDDPVLVALTRWTLPEQGLCWLAWLLPVGQIAALVGAWAATVGIVWAVGVLLRWAKVIV